MVQATDGNFYGVTYQGGTNGLGTIFRLSLSAQPIVIVIQSVSQANGIFNLAWNATPTLTYQLQSNTNLASANWQNLGGTIVATNGTVSASDPIGPDPQRFYRVQLVIAI